MRPEARVEEPASAWRIVRIDQRAMLSFAPPAVCLGLTLIVALVLTAIEPGAWRELDWAAGFQHLARRPLTGLLVLVVMVGLPIDVILRVRRVRRILQEGERHWARVESRPRGPSWELRVRYAEQGAERHAVWQVAGPLGPTPAVGWEIQVALDPRYPERFVAPELLR